MPERLLEADLANEIANSPDAEGLWTHGAVFDFSDHVADPRNVFLTEDGGLAICIWSAPRIFECHLVFPRQHRGKRAIAATKRMVEYMMAEHASGLWCQPSAGMKNVLWLTRQLGFVPAGEATHPVLGPVQYMTKGFA